MTRHFKKGIPKVSLDGSPKPQIGVSEPITKTAVVVQPSTTTVNISNTGTISGKIVPPKAVTARTSNAVAYQGASRTITTQTTSQSMVATRRQLPTVAEAVDGQVVYATEDNRGIRVQADQGDYTVNETNDNQLSEYELDDGTVVAYNIEPISIEVDSTSYHRDIEGSGIEDTYDWVKPLRSFVLELSNVAELISKGLSKVFAENSHVLDEARKSIEKGLNSFSAVSNDIPVLAADKVEHQTVKQFETQAKSVSKPVASDRPWTFDTIRQSFLKSINDSVRVSDNASATLGDQEGVVSAESGRIVELVKANIGKCAQDVLNSLDYLVKQIGLNVEHTSRTVDTISFNSFKSVFSNEASTDTLNKAVSKPFTSDVSYNELLAATIGKRFVNTTTTTEQTVVNAIKVVSLDEHYSDVVSISISALKLDICDIVDQLLLDVYKIHTELVHTSDSVLLSTVKVVNNSVANTSTLWIDAFKTIDTNAISNDTLTISIDKLINEPSQAVDQFVLANAKQLTHVTQSVETLLLSALKQQVDITVLPEALAATFVKSIEEVVRIRDLCLTDEEDKSQYQDGMSISEIIALIASKVYQDSIKAFEVVTIGVDKQHSDFASAIVSLSKSLIMPFVQVTTSFELIQLISAKVVVDLEQFTESYFSILNKAYYETTGAQSQLSKDVAKQILILACSVERLDYSLHLVSLQTVINFETLVLNTFKQVNHQLISSDLLAWNLILTVYNSARQVESLSLIATLLKSDVVSLAEYLYIGLQRQIADTLVANELQLISLIKASWNVTNANDQFIKSLWQRDDTYLNVIDYLVLQLLSVPHDTLVSLDNIHKDSIKVVEDNISLFSHIVVMADKRLNLIETIVDHVFNFFDKVCLIVLYAIDSVALAYNKTFAKNVYVSTAITRTVVKELSVISKSFDAIVFGIENVLQIVVSNIDSISKALSTSHVNAIVSNVQVRLTYGTSFFNYSTISENFAKSVVSLQNTTGAILDNHWLTSNKVINSAVGFFGVFTATLAKCLEIVVSTLEQLVITSQKDYVETSRILDVLDLNTIKRITSDTLHLELVTFELGTSIQDIVQYLDVTYLHFNKVQDSLSRLVVDINLHFNKELSETLDLTDLAVVSSGKALRDVLALQSRYVIAVNKVFINATSAFETVSYSITKTFNETVTAIEYVIVALMFGYKDLVNAVDTLSFNVFTPITSHAVHADTVAVITNKVFNDNVTIIDELLHGANTHYFNAAVFNDLVSWTFSKLASDVFNAIDAVALQFSTRFSDNITTTVDILLSTLKGIANSTSVIEVQALHIVKSVADNAALNEQLLSTVSKSTTELHTLVDSIVLAANLVTISNSHSLDSISLNSFKPVAELAASYDVFEKSIAKQLTNALDVESLLTFVYYKVTSDIIYGGDVVRFLAIVAIKSTIQSIDALVTNVDKRVLDLAHASEYVLAQLFKGYISDVNSSVLVALSITHVIQHTVITLEAFVLSSNLQQFELIDTIDVVTNSIAKQLINSVINVETVSLAANKQHTDPVKITVNTILAFNAAVTDSLQVLQQVIKRLDTVKLETLTTLSQFVVFANKVIVSTTHTFDALTVAFDKTASDLESLFENVVFSDHLVKLLQLSVNDTVSINTVKVYSEAFLAIAQIYLDTTKLVIDSITGSTLLAISVDKICNNFVNSAVQVSLLADHVVHDATQAIDYFKLSQGTVYFNLANVIVQSVLFVDKILYDISRCVEKIDTLLYTGYFDSVSSLTQVVISATHVVNESISALSTYTIGLYKVLTEAVATNTLHSISFNKLVDNSITTIEFTAKQVAKSIAEPVSASILVALSATNVIANSNAATDLLTLINNLIKTNAVSTSSQLQFGVSKQFANSLFTSELVNVQSIKKVVDAISVSSIVTLNVTTILQLLSKTVDTLQLIVRGDKQDSLKLTQLINKQFSTIKQIVLNASDVLYKTIAIARIDSINAIETFSKTVDHLEANAISVADTVVKLSATFVNEAISSVILLTKSIVKTVQEACTGGELYLLTKLTLELGKYFYDTSFSNDVIRLATLKSLNDTFSNSEYISTTILKTTVDSVRTLLQLALSVHTVLLTTASLVETTKTNLNKVLITTETFVESLSTIFDKQVENVIHSSNLLVITVIHTHLDSLITACYVAISGLFVKADSVTLQSSSILVANKSLIDTVINSDNALVNFSKTLEVIVSLTEYARLNTMKLLSNVTNSFDQITYNAVKYINTNASIIDLFNVILSKKLQDEENTLDRYILMLSRIDTSLLNLSEHVYRVSDKLQVNTVDLSILLTKTSLNVLTKQTLISDTVLTQFVKRLFEIGHVVDSFAFDVIHRITSQLASSEILVATTGKVLSHSVLSIESIVTQLLFGQADVLSALDVFITALYKVFRDNVSTLDIVVITSIKQLDSELMAIDCTWHTLGKYISNVESTFDTVSSLVNKVVSSDSIVVNTYVISALKVVESLANITDVIVNTIDTVQQSAVAVAHLLYKAYHKLHTDSSNSTDVFTVNATKFVNETVNTLIHIVLSTFTIKQDSVHSNEAVVNAFYKVCNEFVSTATRIEIAVIQILRTVTSLSDVVVLASTLLKQDVVNISTQRLFSVALVKSDESNLVDRFTKVAQLTKVDVTFSAMLIRLSAYIVRQSDANIYSYLSKITDKVLRNNVSSFELVAATNAKACVDVVNILHQVVKNTSSINLNVANAVDTIVRSVNSVYVDAAHVYETFTFNAVTVFANSLNTLEQLTKASTVVFSKVTSILDVAYNTLTKVTIDAIQTIEYVLIAKLNGVFDTANVMTLAIKLFDKVIANAAQALDILLKNIDAFTINAVGVTSVATRQFNKLVVEALTLVESLTLSVSTKYNELVSITNALTFTFAKTFVDNVATIEHSVVSIDKLIIEVTNLVLQLVRTVVKVHKDALAGSDTFELLMSILKTDTVGSFENSWFNIAKVCSNVLNTFDNLLLYTTKAFNKLVQSDDLFRLVFSKYLVESSRVLDRATLSVYPFTVDDNHTEEQIAYNAILSKVSTMTLLDTLYFASSKYVEDLASAYDNLVKAISNSKIETTNVLSIFDIILYKQLTDTKLVSSVLFKSFDKLLYDVSTSLETCIKTVTKVIATSAAIADTFKATFNKTIEDAYSVDEVIALLVSKLITESLTLTETRVFNILTAMQENLMSSVMLTKSIVKVLFNGVQQIDTFSKTVITVTNVISNLIEALSLNAFKQVQDIAIATSTLNLFVINAQTETLRTLVQIVINATKQITTITNPSDLVHILLSKQLVDNLTSIDSAYLAVQLLKVSTANMVDRIVKTSVTRLNNTLTVLVNTTKTLFKLIGIALNVDETLSVLVTKAMYDSFNTFDSINFNVSRVLGDFTNVITSYTLQTLKQLTLTAASSETLIRASNTVKHSVANVVDTVILFRVTSALEVISIVELFNKDFSKISKDTIEVLCTVILNSIKSKADIVSSLDHLVLNTLSVLNNTIRASYRFEKTIVKAIQLLASASETVVKAIVNLYSSSVGSYEQFRFEGFKYEAETVRTIVVKLLHFTKCWSDSNSLVDSYSIHTLRRVVENSNILDVICFNSNTVIANTSALIEFVIKNASKVFNHISQTADLVAAVLNKIVLNTATAIDNVVLNATSEHTDQIKLNSTISLSAVVSCRDVLTINDVFVFDSFNILANSLNTILEVCINADKTVISLTSLADLFISTFSKRIQSIGSVLETLYFSVMIALRDSVSFNERSVFTVLKSINILAHATDRYLLNLLKTTTEFGATNVLICLRVDTILDYLCNVTDHLTWLLNKALFNTTQTIDTLQLSVLHNVAVSTNAFDNAVLTAIHVVTDIGSIAEEVVYSVIKRFVDCVNSVDSLALVAAKQVSSNSLSTDFVRLNANKAYSETLAAVDTQMIDTLKSIYNVSNSYEQLSRFVNKSETRLVQVLESAYSNVNKIAIEHINLTNLTILSFNKIAVNSVTTIEAVLLSLLYGIADTLTTVEMTTRHVEKVFINAVSTTSILQNNIGNVVNELCNSIETVRLAAYIQLVNNGSAFETISLNAQMILSESLNTLEIAIKTIGNSYSNTERLIDSFEYSASKVLSITADCIETVKRIANKVFTSNSHSHDNIMLSGFKRVIEPVALTSVHVLTSLKSVVNDVSSVVELKLTSIKQAIDLNRAIDYTVVAFVKAAKDVTSILDTFVKSVFTVQYSSATTVEQIVYAYVKVVNTSIALNELLGLIVASLQSNVINTVNTVAKALQITKHSVLNASDIHVVNTTKRLNTMTGVLDLLVRSMIIGVSSPEAFTDMLKLTVNKVYTAASNAYDIIYLTVSKDAHDTTSVTNVLFKSVWHVVNNVSNAFDFVLRYLGKQQFDVTNVSDVTTKLFNTNKTSNTNLVDSVVLSTHAAIVELFNSIDRLVVNGVKVVVSNLHVTELQQINLAKQYVDTTNIDDIFKLTLTIINAIVTNVYSNTWLTIGKQLSNVTNAFEQTAIAVSIVYIDTFTSNELIVKSNIKTVNNAVSSIVHIDKSVTVASLNTVSVQDHLTWIPYKGLIDTMQAMTLTVFNVVKRVFDASNIVERLVYTLSVKQFDLVSADDTIYKAVNKQANDTQSVSDLYTLVNTLLKRVTSSVYDRVVLAVVSRLQDTLNAMDRVSLASSKALGEYVALSELKQLTLNSVVQDGTQISNLTTLSSSNVYSSISNSVVLLAKHLAGVRQDSLDLLDTLELNSVKTEQDVTNIIVQHALNAIHVLRISTTVLCDIALNFSKQFNDSESVIETLLFSSIKHVYNTLNIDDVVQAVISKVINIQAIVEDLYIFALSKLTTSNISISDTVAFNSFVIAANSVNNTDTLTKRVDSFKTNISNVLVQLIKSGLKRIYESLNSDDLVYFSFSKALESAITFEHTVQRNLSRITAEYSFSLETTAKSFNKVGRDAVQTVCNVSISKSKTLYNWVNSTHNLVLMTSLGQLSTTLLNEALILVSICGTLEYTSIMDRLSNIVNKILGESCAVGHTYVMVGHKVVSELAGSIVSLLLHFGKRLSNSIVSNDMWVLIANKFSSDTEHTSDTLYKISSKRLDDVVSSFDITSLYTMSVILESISTITTIILVNDKQLFVLNQTHELLRISQLKTFVDNALSTETVLKQIDPSVLSTVASSIVVMKVVTKLFYNELISIEYYVKNVSKFVSNVVNSNDTVMYTSLKAIIENTNITDVLLLNKLSVLHDIVSTTVTILQFVNKFIESSLNHVDNISLSIGTSSSSSVNLWSYVYYLASCQKVNIVTVHTYINKSIASIIEIACNVVNILTKSVNKIATQTVNTETQLAVNYVKVVTEQVQSIDSFDLTGSNVTNFNSSDSSSLDELLALAFNKVRHIVSSISDTVHLTVSSTVHDNVLLNTLLTIFVDNVINSFTVASDLFSIANNIYKLSVVNNATQVNLNTFKPFYITHATDETISVTISAIKTSLVDFIDAHYLVMLKNLMSVSNVSENIILGTSADKRSLTEIVSYLTKSIVKDNRDLVSLYTYLKYTYAKVVSYFVDISNTIYLNNAKLFDNSVNTFTMLTFANVLSKYDSTNTINTLRIIITKPVAVVTNAVDWTVLDYSNGIQNVVESNDIISKISFKTLREYFSNIDLISFGFSTFKSSTINALDRLVGFLNKPLVEHANSQIQVRKTFTKTVKIIETIYDQLVINLTRNTYEQLDLTESVRKSLTTVKISAVQSNDQGAIGIWDYCSEDFFLTPADYVGNTTLFT